MGVSDDIEVAAASLDLPGRGLQRVRADKRIYVRAGALLKKAELAVADRAAP